MPRKIGVSAARLAPKGVGVVLMVALYGCQQQPTPGNPDIEITSRSVISGLVNEEVVRGTILATFNTGIGGTSTCQFDELPQGFTPATFGTHT